MKQLLLILLMIPGLAAHATELNPAIRDLNAAIEEILAPVRDADTQVAIEFTDIQTNAERALAVSLRGHYKKTGPANFVELRLDQLDYAYGDGTAPISRIKGHLGTDITKILNAEQVNRLVPEIESMIHSIAGDAVREYGDAATVKVEITDRRKNEAGDFTAVSGRIGVYIDLAKLPGSKKSEDIMVTAFEADVSADVKTGFTVSATLISNPAYRGFHTDNEGLKDLLDRFLSREPSTLAELQKFILDLNELAGRVAHGQL